MLVARRCVRLPHALDVVLGPRLVPVGRRAAGEARVRGALVPRPRLLARGHVRARVEVVRLDRAVARADVGAVVDGAALAVDVVPDEGDALGVAAPLRYALSKNIHVLLY